MIDSEDLKKSAILDLQHWIDATTSAIFYLLQEQLGAEEIPPNVWSRRHSRDFLYKAMVDTLNSSMKWCKLKTNLSGDFLDETLGEYFRQHDVDHLMDEVIQLLDNVEIHVRSEICDRTAVNPWQIWDIKLMGEYVILDRDEDYRIQIFNEKVAAGDWSL
jgi:hypothetical protein